MAFLNIDDFRFSGDVSGTGSSVVIIYPKNRRASHWLADHLPHEPGQLINGGIACDYSRAVDIFSALTPLE